MTPPKRPPFDEDDITSLYLRRMRGDNSPAETASTTEAAPAEARARAGDEGLQATGAQTAATPGKPPSPPAPAQANDNEALPPGAPVVYNAATQASAQAPTPQVQSGALPVHFASEGLNMLRLGDHGGAAGYYEAEAKRDPARAEGWLGIGAAFFGAGQFKKALTYLLKGAHIDTRFPIGALLEEAKPGQPRVMFNMAELFLTIDDPVAVQTAISILETCMASPAAPADLYASANEMRRHGRERLEDMELADKPALLAMKKGARRQKVTSHVVRVVMTLVVVVGLSVGVWFGYHFVQFRRYMSAGMLDFKEAYRTVNLGTSTLNATKNATPSELYRRAFDAFEKAAAHRPTSFTALFMSVRSGQHLLQLARGDKLTQKVSPQMLGQIEQDVKKAQARMRTLDPSGKLSRDEQNELNETLQQQ